jgi:hypothetical protein
LDLPCEDEVSYTCDEGDSGQDAKISPDGEPATNKEIYTPAGPITVIIHVGIVQIRLPLKPDIRTPELMNALNEAIVFYERILLIVPSTSSSMHWKKILMTRKLRT